MMIGDLAFRNLAPKTTNLGHRLVKNMRICGSGIYTYHKSEVPLLNLGPIPPEYKDLEYINVFRPAEVLRANKDKFARIPIITGRHVLVDTENAKELAVGMVGDTVETEVDKQDGELYLYTTGTIIAGDGVKAYENYGQLSVGYDPIMQWQKGQHNGNEYQAVLVGFRDVNHLLICETARGGPQIMIMDSLDGKSPLEKFVQKNIRTEASMGIFKKIFGSAAKEETKVAGDSVLVSALLQSVAVGADPATQIEKVRTLVGDSADDTFKGYLDELAGAKDEKLETIAKAVGIVDKYYKEHIAGDSESKGTDGPTDLPKDKAGDAESPIVDDKKKDEKPAGDEGHAVACPKCGKDPCVCDKGEEKKSVGDSVDINALAEKVAAIVLAAQAAQAKQVAGDAAKEVAPTADVTKYAVNITGDEKATSLSSDSVMKSLFGGE